MKKLLSLTILAVLTISCSFSQSNNASASVDIDAQGPIITFDKTSHDYGTMKQNADGKFDFRFTNEGTEPLILSNVRSSCGCTVPQWPREPIAPGESASIQVKYDTRRIGNFSKSITVYSNGSSQPVMLRIKGKVEVKEAAAQ